LRQFGEAIPQEEVAEPHPPTSFFAGCKGAASLNVELIENKGTPVQPNSRIAREDLAMPHANEDNANSDYKRQ
jgi:hypothetical protein